MKIFYSKLLTLFLISLFFLSCNSKKDSYKVQNKEIHEYDYDQLFVLRAHSFFNQHFTKEEINRIKLSSKDSLINLISDTLLKSFSSYLLEDEFSKIYVDQLESNSIRLLKGALFYSWYLKLNGLPDNTPLYSKESRLRSEALSDCLLKGRRNAEYNFTKFEELDTVKFYIFYSDNADVNSHKYGSYKSCLEELSDKAVRVLLKGVINKKYYNKRIRKYYFQLSIQEVEISDLYFQGDFISKGDTFELDLVEYNLELN